MGSTITKQKNNKSHVIFLVYLLGCKKWVIPSRSQKNNKSQVKSLFFLYWAAKNAFYHQEAKKTTNLTKNFLRFFIGGRKMGFTITKPKNNKSHVKCIFIIYLAAKNALYHQQAKITTNLMKISFYFLLGGENEFYHHKAKKTANPA